MRPRPAAAPVPDGTVGAPRRAPSQVRLLAVDAERVGRARDRVPAADDIARLTGLLSLLSDPVRLRILYALDIADELCVGDVALALGINPDQASYGLRLLRSAGLVRTRRHGRVVFNRLAAGFPEPLREHCLHQLVELARRAGDREG